MADVIITATGGTGTKTYYDTDICNMALARLGNADNYLTSTILTNNSTKEARLCNLNYYHALKLALARHEWKCTLVRDELSLDDEADQQFGLPYAYAIPDDCILIREVSDDESASNPALQWRREGRYIYTTVSEGIYLTYVTSDNTSDEQDVHFIEFLVCSLALMIAPSLVVSEQVIARLEKQRDRALVEARSIDGTDESEETMDLWEDAGRTSVSSQFSPAVHD